jgi:hypothetical protein
MTVCVAEIGTILLAAGLVMLWIGGIYCLMLYLGQRQGYARASSAASRAAQLTPLTSEAGQKSSLDIEARSKL